MKYPTCVVLLLGLLLLNTTASVHAADKKQASLAVFKDYVEPLLKNHCYDCHSHDADSASGGLVLDSQAGWKVGGDSGPAIVPGKPEKSLLLEAIQYGNEHLQMPPDGKLSQQAIANVEKWIKLGAADPRGGKVVAKQGIDLEAGKQFWSFRPLQQVTPPQVTQADWPNSQIDRFILARLEAEGLPPAPPAKPEVLLRRAYYDLTGLPPSADEVTAFVQEAQQDFDTAFASVVDRLLGSQQYGEKWGRHWLDLARYADSNGSSFNPPFRVAWRYRNWVIDAYNRDLPFNEFVTKQLAGDLLPYQTQAERDNNLTATGFLVLGSKVLGLFDKEQLYLDVADEQIDTVGKSMLGMTIACARCHDHKFDPIPQTDYYALAGIFLSTVTLENRLGGPKADESDWSRRGLGAGGDAKLQAFLQEHRHDWVDAVNDRFRAKRKLAELRQEESPDRNQLAQARKAYAKHSKQLEEFLQQMPKYAMAVRDVETPADTELRIRGVPASKGATVPRGFLSVATTEDHPKVNSKQSGRLELARWIASPENPLTGRVYVNRVWKHLFGEGIVRSVDNFGVRGNKPSHPQLLDYLAQEFIDQGWSTKQLVREIVLSQTYRMATVNTSLPKGTDPENYLLARQNRRRLEPEEIRDTLLQLSGTLEKSPGEGMIDHLPISDISNLGDALKIENHKRTIYQPLFRTLEPDVWQIFDAANSAVTTGARAKTIVAPQALYLLNSPFVQQSSMKMARRTLAAIPAEDTEGIIRNVFLQLVSRIPNDREQAILRQYFANQFAGDTAPSEHDVSKLIQTVLASTQFQFIE